MERQNKSHRYHRPSIVRTDHVHCTVYSVQCTVYSVQCTVYCLQNIFFLNFCLVFVLGGQTMKKSHKHHRPSIVSNVLYRVQCAVYSVQCTGYSIRFFIYLFLFLFGVDQQWQSLRGTTCLSLLNDAARVCIHRCMGFSRGKYTVPRGPPPHCLCAGSSYFLQ